MTGDPCAWDLPATPLAPNLWCGTSLCLPAAIVDSTYGSFNLAMHVGDDPSAVQANRRRLQLSLGVGPLQWLEQVHGTAVVQATLDSPSQVPVADAVWTRVPGLAVAVLTADCLPVVLAAKDGSCVGVAHGGWRGLVDGVLPALVAAMPVAAADIVAWGGPGIGVKAYEVGPEVAAAVEAVTQSEGVITGGVRAGKYQLDLQGLAAATLASCGVLEYQASERCAYTDAGCYSYRRVGGKATGRMATIGLLGSR